MPANLIAVTVVGNDRPGIVAGVTKVLYDLGCNLEDVSSTILRGHFSMMLIVSSPSDAPALEEGLAAAGAELNVVVTARPVDKADVAVTPPSLMVSVYGSDKPGIVYRVADALAGAGANITDLTSRVIGTADEPIYALMLEVAATDKPVVEEALAAVSEELGVDIAVHPIEADVL